ncbi:MAG: LysR family transcriptional regulator [Pseudomonadota bacterium]
MQQWNWNDLRYLLALERGRTLSGAARLIGADETTVSRRLKVLRELTGDDLYWRQRDGTLMLTDVGAQIAEHGALMEAQAEHVSELLGQDQERLSGTVRLTSVPLLINRFLANQIGTLMQQHPALILELNPDSRDLDLNLREADIALRLSRPRSGGSETLARRVGELPYGVFASRSSPTKSVDTLPWVGYEETTSHLPQARWIAKMARQPGQALAGLKVMDADTAMEAAVAGVGRTLLPIPIARETTGLVLLSGDEPVLSREIWLLTHLSQSEWRRIKVVASWIEEALHRLLGDR